MENTGTQRSESSVKFPKLVGSTAGSQSQAFYLQTHAQDYYKTNFLHEVCKKESLTLYQVQFFILTSFQPHLFSVDSRSSQCLRPWSRTSPAGECPVFLVIQLWMHTFIFSSLAVMVIWRLGENCEWMTRCPLTSETRQQLLFWKTVRSAQAWDIHVPCLTSLSVRQKSIYLSHKANVETDKKELSHQFHRLHGSDLRL